MVMAVEDSAVQVVVRVRPPTPRELESQRRPVIQVVDERVLVFDPEEPDGGFVGLKWGGVHEGPRKKGKDLTFVFDRVLGEAASQQDIFQHTTRRLLDSFLQGFNCSGERRRRCLPPCVPSPSAGHSLWLPLHLLLCARSSPGPGIHSTSDRHGSVLLYLQCVCVCVCGH